MHHAIFYEFPEADPNTDRFTYETANGGVTVVLVDDPSKVPAIAKEMVEKGAELVELCGGMPLSVRAKVRAALPAETGVASVSFGIESIVMAAEFNRAFMDGKPPAEACIVSAPGADSDTNRFVRHAGPQNATFVMADERVAPDIARQLADRGVGLIELYGGFSDEAASQIIEAVSGRAAVGMSGFGHRSPNVHVDQETVR